MRCPDCHGMALRPWFETRGGPLHGVYCPACEKRWVSDTLSVIYEELHLQLERQLSHILDGMEFKNVISGEPLV